MTTLGHHGKIHHSTQTTHLLLREALGAALYQNKRYREAEQVFRQHIQHTDRKANFLNARSLFELYKTLEAQGKFE